MRTLFLKNQDNVKESMHCIRCGAWMRLRFLAHMLIDTYGSCSVNSLMDLTGKESFSKLRIYELACQGPLHRVLKKCPRYTCSEYIKGTPLGSIHLGRRCEDFQRLTFENEVFDLIIHTSVLEHVRRPTAALREAYRVLDKGGRMFMEVPLNNFRTSGLRPISITRVATRGPVDRYLVPPVYHSDPLDPKGVLVYTDFGLDIIGLLEEIGFSVGMKRKTLLNSTMNDVVVIVAHKQ